MLLRALHGSCLSLQVAADGSGVLVLQGSINILSALLKAHSGNETSALLKQLQALGGNQAPAQVRLERQFHPLQQMPSLSLAHP